jgi:hypothetical protein
MYVMLRGSAYFLSLRVENKALFHHERRQISEILPCQVEKVNKRVIETCCIFNLKTYSKNSMSNGAFSTEAKRPRRETDHWLPSCAEVKKEWSCNSILPYTFTLFIRMYLSYIQNILKFVCRWVTLEDKDVLPHGGGGGGAGKAIGIHFPVFYTVASTQRRLLGFARSVCLNKVLFRFRDGWLNVSVILILPNWMMIRVWMKGGPTLF